MQAAILLILFTFIVHNATPSNDDVVLLKTGGNMGLFKTPELNWIKNPFPIGGKGLRGCLHFLLIII